MVDVGLRKARLKDALFELAVRGVKIADAAAAAAAAADDDDEKEEDGDSMACDFSVPVAAFATNELSPTALLLPLLSDARVSSYSPSTVDDGRLRGDGGGIRGEEGTNLFVATLLPAKFRPGVA